MIFERKILTHGSQGMPMGPLTWANGRTVFWLLLGAVSLILGKRDQSWIHDEGFLPASWSRVLSWWKEDASHSNFCMFNTSKPVYMQINLHIVSGRCELVHVWLFISKVSMAMTMVILWTQSGIVSSLKYAGIWPGPSLADNWNDIFHNISVVIRFVVFNIYIYIFAMTLKKGVVSWSHGSFLGGVSLCQPPRERKMHSMATELRHGPTEPNTSVAWVSAEDLRPGWNHGWSTYPPLTYTPPRNKALLRAY